LRLPWLPRRGSAEPNGAARGSSCR
jgi:hypothetical protein